MLIEEYRKHLKNLKDHYKDTEQFPFQEEFNRIAEMEKELDIDYILADSSDLIRESHNGTERIKKIVSDLKNYAHPGEDKMKYADINKNLESTLNVVWNELKYKAEVIRDYQDIPLVECFPQQLNQVFGNILVNAAQAIEKNGRISIATRNEEENVVITITDNGEGIPDENLPRIFDPFFTTKEVGKGTGLGLNVAYNIIKKHNGRIEIKSRVGEGTAFIITIPCSFSASTGKRE
jgi:signal transduction histidine kinase